MARQLFRYVGLILSLMLATESSYGQWPIVQLTNNDLMDMNPDVSGGNVVWQTGPSGWGPNIYLNNGLQTQLIASNGAWYASPHISGDTIVWAGGTDWTVDNCVNIYRDGTITTVTATEKTYGDRYVNVWGSTVVWENTGWIWEFADGQVRKISSSQANICPAACGQEVVWQRYDSSWLLTRLCGTSESILDDRLSSAPRISEGRIVYAKNYQENSEIFLYDGGTSRQLTHNTLRDGSPDIDGSLVVWSEDDGHDTEIFAYDGNQTFQITNNAYNDEAPSVSGNRIVWQEYDGHDYEIYTTVIPEPATIVLLIVGALTVRSRNRKTTGGRM